MVSVPFPQGPSSPTPFLLSVSLGLLSFCISAFGSPSVITLCLQVPGGGNEEAGRI